MFLVIKKKHQKHGQENLLQFHAFGNKEYYMHSPFFYTTP